MPKEEIQNLKLKKKKWFEIFQSPEVKKKQIPISQISIHGFLHVTKNSVFYKFPILWCNCHARDHPQGDLAIFWAMPWTMYESRNLLKSFSFMATCFKQCAKKEWFLFPKFDHFLGNIQQIFLFFLPNELALHICFYSKSWLNLPMDDGHFFPSELQLPKCWHMMLASPPWCIMLLIAHCALDTLCE